MDRFHSESDIQIRHYEEKDLVSVLGLMHELGYPLDLQDLQFNADLVRQRGGMILVAETGANVVGCVCAAVNGGLAEGLYGEIISLVVSADCRGKEIGTRLVRKAEDWLKARVSKVRIRTNAIRLKAHEFYKSLGYEEIKTQKVFMITL